jgi:glycosyltransferase involved in cell wall biosynthesis
MNKGLKEALTAAQLTKKELSFVGTISDQEYFEREIVPLLKDGERYMHPQFHSLAEKAAFFGNAKACILPIMWEDPFPYVVLEALATGTPIIGFARGSFPESVLDGKTGFLVNPSDDDIRGDYITKKTGIAGICEAIDRMYLLNETEYTAMRKNCHERIKTTFSIESMISEYINLYKEVLHPNFIS